MIKKYILNHSKNLPPNTETAQQPTATTTVKLARGYYYDYGFFLLSLNLNQ